MEQFIEFIGNHWLLSSAWVLTLAAIIVYHQQTGSKSLSPAQAVALINRKGAVVVDLREKKEFETGHIVDSVNIPLAKLDQRITELGKHKEKPVILVCTLGQQSGQAGQKLQADGFGEVNRLAGGISEWKAQGLPLVSK